MLSLPSVNLPLAISDLLVVALAGCGWFVVARLLLRRHQASGDVAVFGTALVILGGASRTLWTIIGTEPNQNLEWLGNILFPLLCAGFICLAVALWRGLSAERTVYDESLMVWGMPIFLCLLTIALAVFCEEKYPGRGWFRVMIFTLTAANLCAVALLILHSRRLNANWAAFFLALHIIAFLSLAAASLQTGAMRLIKLGINIFSQSTFLLAAFILYSRSFSQANKPLKSLFKKAATRQ